MTVNKFILVMCVDLHCRDGQGTRWYNSFNSWASALLHRDTEKRYDILLVL